MNYLSGEQLVRVSGLWPIYLTAVGKVGLPAAWAFGLAGVHSCESGWSPTSPHGEIGGGFCFDPGGRGYPGTPLEQIVAHATRVCKVYGYAPHDPTLDTDFLAAAIVAADELREKAHPRPIVVGSYPEVRDVIGWAAWGYNGRAAWCCEAFQRDGAGHPYATRPTWRWAPYCVNDPLNGNQLYRGSGHGEVAADGGHIEIKGRSPSQNPGVLIIGDELRARWSEWYTGPHTA